MRAALDFSVVVPTYKRPDRLAACLASMQRLAYPRERFEVIVVDDSGGAALDPLVQPFRETLDLHLLVQGHAGPARARNHGASRARGTFLAFTDDDCQVEPAWLGALAERLKRSPEHLVGGRTLNALSSNCYSAASQLILDRVYAHFNADPQDARFFASNNLALGRILFHEVGGFDEGWVVLACEDRELCDRWRHGGRRIAHVPDAVVHHAHPLGLSSYCRQFFTHGRGALHYHRLRKLRGSGRLRQELSFHLDVRNWLVEPFRGASLGSALRLAALLMLWQVANAAGFAFESLHRGGYRPRAT